MDEKNPIVAKAMHQVGAGWREHETRMRRYDRAYDVYRASEPKAPGVDPWQSKLRIPFGRYVIDTELVNLVSGNPRCKVTARNPHSEMGAKAMQYVLDYFVAEDHMAEKQPSFVQSGLVFGVAAAKPHWLYRTAKRPQKSYRENPLDPSAPEMDVQDIELITADRPTFEVWNPYHIYWEPGARDVDSAAYVVMQSWVSKDDLLKLRYNPDTKHGLYHNVDELLELGDGRKPDTTAQTRARNFSDERYKGKFLLEEIWTDESLIVVGNKEVLMRAQQNPYWHGHKPVVVAQTMPDLFELEGISETEAVDHLQQALWTVQNMRMDNLHLTTMRGITYREGGVTDPNDLVLKPRFRWGVSDHDDIKPFEVSPLPREAYEEEQSLLGRMQQVTGISPYVSGADTTGVDQNTATGITALQGAASRLLQFKANQIHRKGYQRAYEMFGDMVQQFLDRTIATKIIGPDREPVWVESDPQDIVGHFNYVLEGTDESLTKNQAKSDSIALLNAFAPLVQTGQVNIKPILEQVAVAYGFENPEELFPPPQTQVPPAAPNGPGNMPPQAGQPPQLLGGQTMDPAILNAITNR